MGRRLRPASLYPDAGGSVLVPLALHGLPEHVQVGHEAWELVEEFHVTAAHTPRLAERSGASLAQAWAELSGRLGAPLAPPPTHITLYRRPGGESIGIHDETDLRELTRPLRPREDRVWREAIGFHDVLG
jgi:hypothetical protein